MGWFDDLASSIGRQEVARADANVAFAQNTSATAHAIRASGQQRAGVDAPMRPQKGSLVGYHGGACEDVPPKVWALLPFERGAQLAPAVVNAPETPATTVRTPDASFLYLDVGRWGGTGTDANRDFAIVCGRTAALCAFTTGTGGKRYTQFPRSTARVADTVGPRLEVEPINALLGLLAGSALGAPAVRRALSVNTQSCEAPPGKVHVIVGDMHLPVTTRVRVDGPPPTPQDELRRGRVRRAGTPGDPGVMSAAEAAAWQDLYFAAEIFGDAGPDLSAFVTMLRAARGSLGGPDLWLLQLGDMFDLWLGFDRYFKAHPDRPQEGNGGQVILEADEPPMPDLLMATGAMGIPVPVGVATPLSEVNATTRTTPMEFVDTWVNRTLGATSQSDHVVHFLEFDPTHSSFLYGNHDNYLAKAGASGREGLVKCRPKDYASAGLYACHGHQWDDYNRDGATAGQTMTQTAFWSGQFVRMFEGLGPDPRVAAILGFVEMFQSGRRFSVFAMGHTHTAVLTEVVINVSPNPPY